MGIQRPQRLQVTWQRLYLGVVEVEVGREGGTRALQNLTAGRLLSIPFCVPPENTPRNWITVLEFPYLCV